jgi:glucoamylase
MRAAVGFAAILAIGAAFVSGGSSSDSLRYRYLPTGNELRTVERYGKERVVSVRSLGAPNVVWAARGWLALARPLDAGAPLWARRLYRRSLLVLRALTDRRSGAVIAGARDGWAYVWPRDAGAVAIAFAAAGYRGEARRVVHFLLALDLGTAARFHRDGAPVEGRAAQGDAAGWVAAAARAAELQPEIPPQPWRDLADYQEGDPGDYLANALAAGPVIGHAARDEEAIRVLFGTGAATLSREADDPSSGLDSAAAWAVRPFPHPALYPLVRRTLLRLAAESGRFGVVPSQSWGGGEDPWTAPTAWTAWSLAALGERRAALHLIAELRRTVTPAGMLPERVDANTGVPISTTPLAWSHAFAILALRQLWP